jgi:hypothetical protein
VRAFLKDNPAVRDRLHNEVRLALGLPALTAIPAPAAKAAAEPLQRARTA